MKTLNRFIMFIVASLLLRMPANADPIRDAAASGNLRTVQRLVRADPRVVNSRVRPGDGASWEIGATPLHAAARNGHLEVVRFLLACGADVNALRNDGESALSEAAFNDRDEVAQLLIAAGARVNTVGVNDYAPLHWAAERASPQMVRVLLAGGAQIDARRPDGWTPLHAAANNDNTGTLRALLEKGAQPDVRLTTGETPLHLAAKGGHDRSIALLLSNGQNIEMPNADGNTPLMIAAWYGQMAVGRFLIGAGADVNAQNKAGHTALDEALRNHQNAFADLIRNYQLALDARVAFDRAVKSVGDTVRSGYLNWAMPAHQVKRVYFNDFDSDQVGPEWTTFPQPGAQQGALRVSATPRGAHQFLGDLGSQTLRLALSNLPPHREISFVFDLYILRTWDGNNLNAGPDVWSLSLPDGPTLLHTTFANAGGVIGAEVRLQAYPGIYPGDHHGCGFGSVETNTLGYTASEEGRQVPMDTVYRLSYTLAHTSSSLLLDFSAVGLEALDNESWGVTNVQVSVAAPIVSSSRPTLARISHVSSSSRSVARSTPRSASPRRSMRPATTRVTKSKPAGSGAPTKRLHPKEKPPGM